MITAWSCCGFHAAAFLPSNALGPMLFNYNEINIFSKNANIKALNIDFQLRLRCYRCRA